MNYQYYSDPEGMRAQKKEKKRKKEWAPLPPPAF